MKARNLVKFRVSYCDLVFEFDEPLSAAKFMDEALTHLVESESDKTSIKMERIVVEEEN